MVFVNTDYDDGFESREIQARLDRYKEFHALGLATNRDAKMQLDGRKPLEEQRTEGKRSKLSRKSAIQDFVLV